MNSKRFTFGLVVFSLFVQFGFAQPAPQPAEQSPSPAEQAAPPAEQAAPPAEQAAPPAEQIDDGDKSDPLKEQIIYVPYENLPQVFEKPARGVFLPYEQFQKLWDSARKSRSPEIDQGPPLRSLITSIESAAEVRGDVMEVHAQLAIQLLGEGWHEIPLRLADAAISSAKIGEENARIVFRPGQGYFLLLEYKDGQADKRTLDLTYAKTYAKSPGLNQVGFQAPQASINRWKITIKDEGVKVNVRPLVAATETRDGAEMDNGDTPTPQLTTETVLIAFFGLTPQVQIDWTPKSEGASGLAALATVQTRQNVIIGEGSQRTQATLTYSITRSELKELKIRIPAGQKIAGVFDANVRRWDVTLVENAQIVNVELFEPATMTQNINLELERFDLEVGMQNDAVDVVIPEIEALGVSRQQGLVMVRTEGDLRADVTTRTGLLQVDNQEAGNQQGAWDFVYRYAAPPYELILKIEKVQPRVSAEEFVNIQVLEDQVRVDVMTLFNVERAGIFQVEYKIPEGYTVRDVHGVQAADYQPVIIENHHLVENAPGVYRVNFSRKAFGLVGLHLGLERRHNDENLVTPTGVRTEYTFELARVVPASVDHVRGRLLILAPEGLRLTPKDTAGGQSVAVNEIQAEHVVPLSILQNARPAQGFRYAEEIFAPVFDVERRKPHVEVGQLIVADVDQGEVNFKVGLHYNIRYSGLKTFRLDVPSAIADLIGNDSSDFISQRVIEPNPVDLKEGYLAWELTSNRELLGPVTINLSWNQTLQALDLNATDSVVVGKLLPQSVNRSWGQLAIKKAENLDVAPVKDSTEGLRAIDPQHDLKLDGDTNDTTLAMEFHGDQWALELEVNRYEQEDVEKTAVEMGYVRVQLSKGDNAAVHAVFRMRSVDQRISLRMPTDTQLTNDPLRINGASVGLEINPSEERSYFIPLTTQSQGETFVVELVYNVSSGSSKITLPVFQNVKAVNQIFVAAEIPTDRLLLSYSGDWDDHLEGSWLEQLQSLLLTGQGHYFNAQQVVDEVTAGVNVDAIYPGYQKRTLYFSTINPQESPLTLKLAEQFQVNMVLFAGLILLGVIGLFLSLRMQFALLLLVIGASLGVAMISPVLTSSLELSGVIFGIAMMTAVWVLQDISKPFVGVSRKLVGSSKKSSQQSAELSTATENVEKTEEGKGIDDDNAEPIALTGSADVAAETEQDSVQEASIANGDQEDSLSHNANTDQSSEELELDSGGDQDDDSNTADETEEPKE